MNILQCSRGSVRHFEHAVDLLECSQTPPQSMATLEPSLFPQTVQFYVEHDCLFQANRVHKMNIITVSFPPPDVHESLKYQKLAAAVFPSHREEFFLPNNICEIMKSSVWKETTLYSSQSTVFIPNSHCTSVWWEGLSKQ
jgi:hypothetical protein